ncbi:hypothetical protein PRO82_000732 [Candidatus Protochlamydia amoebophila]|nr:hypothetical protein [Candidatus Protochlamydia amoebophila]
MSFIGMFILNISTTGFNSSYLVHTTALSNSQSQGIDDPLMDENTPLDNPLPNLEETSVSTILASDYYELTEVVKV